MLKSSSHGRQELSGGLSKNQKRHRKQRANKKEQKDFGELNQKRDEKFEGKEKFSESNEPKEMIKSADVKIFPSNEPKKEQQLMKKEMEVVQTYSNEPLLQQFEKKVAASKQNEARQSNEPKRAQV